MIATGQIIPLPASMLVQIENPGQAASSVQTRPQDPRPRLYRLPRMDSWEFTGVYGADGRTSHDAVTGRRIDLLA